MLLGQRQKVQCSAD